MRRTKLWWAGLTPSERSELVSLERSANKFGPRGGYLPDDCSECSECGDPTLSGGLCMLCSRRLDDLIRKANGDEGHPIVGTFVTSQPDPGRA